MKKIIFALGIVALMVGCAGFETKAPPAVLTGVINSSNCSGTQICRDPSTGLLVIPASTVAATGTEYLVWAIPDSNGDIVAMSTVECSVITDGSQVCQIHYWVMSDTAGTLTEEFTVDTASD